MLISPADGSAPSVPPVKEYTTVSLAARADPVAAREAIAKQNAEMCFSEREETTVISTTPDSDQPRTQLIQRIEAERQLRPIWRRGQYPGYESCLKFRLTPPD